MGDFRTADQPDQATSADKQPPTGRFQDRRTYVYLALAAAFIGLISLFTMTLRANYHNHYRIGLENFGHYILFANWLAAALCATSAAGRRAEAVAPGLDRFKAAAAILIVADLALRLLPSTIAIFKPPVLSITIPTVLLLVVAPLWLLKAAGRRPGLAFLAGLAGTIPFLPVPPVLFMTLGEHPNVFLMTLYRFDVMLLDIMISLFVITALAALATLVRVRRNGDGPSKAGPVGPAKMTAALIAASALILAGFMVLGHRLDQIRPESAAWNGTSKIFRFADLEIKIPADLKISTSTIDLRLGGEKFTLTETAPDSAGEVEEEIAWLTGRKPGANRRTRDLIRQLRAWDGPYGYRQWPDLNELAPAKILADLGRDMRDETDFPSQLVVAADVYRGEAGDREPVPRLKLSLFVRYGPAGLAWLEQTRLLDPALTHNSPELREAQARAADAFLLQALAFFHTYRWLGPDSGETGGPGWHTGLGLLPAPPDNPAVRLELDAGPRKRTTLRIRREPEPEPAEDLTTAQNLINFATAYYLGYRQWSGPLEAAGRPGRLMMYYPARPGLFPSPGLTHWTWVIWAGEDRKNFLWEISFIGLSSSRAAGGDLDLLGQGEALINSFRYVGDNSNGAPLNLPPQPKDVGDGSSDTSLNLPPQPGDGPGGETP